MKLTEQKAIEVLTTYAPQVGEGNNWNLLIEAIKKLREEKLEGRINQFQFNLIMITVNTCFKHIDYKNTFWAVVEAINFINELKNGD